MKRYTLIIGILCLTAMGACGSRQAGRGAAVTLPEGFELPQGGEGEGDIVRHEGYTARYNHQTLVPDWVAWELTAEEVAGRCDSTYPFSRDPMVSFPKASREDYSHSGWDKGHMAPKADMRWSCKARMESYYFSNVCPQDPVMNAQAWRKIEELTRRLARREGRVFVVCGPVWDSTNHRHIGPACVHVPDRFFKALAVVDDEGVATVGFLVQNTPQRRSPQSYAVTVDSIEALTGWDLFPSLKGDEEASFDWRRWDI